MRVAIRNDAFEEGAIDAVVDDVHAHRGYAETIAHERRVFDADGDNSVRFGERLTLEPFKLAALAVNVPAPRGWVSVAWVRSQIKVSTLCAITNVFAAGTAQRDNAAGPLGLPEVDITARGEASHGRIERGTGVRGNRIGQRGGQIRGEPRVKPRTDFGGTTCSTSMASMP